MAEPHLQETPTARIIRLLRPAPHEIVALARREGDLRAAAEFDPITGGPLGAIVMLVGIGLAGIAIAPFRLGRRWLRRQR